MAVAVVIGAAFGSVVTALVKDLITLALSWMTTLCEGGTLPAGPMGKRSELNRSGFLPIPLGQSVLPTHLKSSMDAGLETELSLAAKSSAAIFRAAPYDSSRHQALGGARVRSPRDGDADARWQECVRA